MDKKSKCLIQMLAYLSEDKRVSGIEMFEDYADFIYKVANSPPELCLIRLGLNEIPGLKVAEMVQQISRDTKIVFLSDDRDYALDAYEIGAYGYLLSPISKDKFEKCLKEVI